MRMLRKFITMTERHEKTCKSLSEMRREEERLLNEIENRIKSCEQKRRLRSAVENRVKILREFIQSISPIPEDEGTDEEDFNHSEDESNKDIRVTQLINEYRKASNKKHIGDTYQYEIKSITGEPLCRVTTAFLIQKYPTSEPEKKRAYRIVYDVVEGEIYRYAYEIIPQDAIQFQQAMRMQPGGLKDLPLYSQVQNQPVKIEITSHSTHEIQWPKFPYEDISTNTDKSDKDYSPTQKKSTNKRAINIKTLKQKLDALYRKGRPKKKAKQPTRQDQPDANTSTIVKQCTRNLDSSSSS
ncbi:PREDICTED: uncharacterized protein LOC108758757 [Trachymyrmex cornetzi]|uniref:uncharacterized protein LOC108758757 n=1 Tax=Trachymyrmex cornetzi TaxID=471704 RepID=UPI00084F67F6|nr:PREDICTED: uncharacterized protein LOC108758757 [Trachymyrmex cornetzi]